MLYAEGDYEVEKVVDVRVLDGEVGYLVKWKGWSSESNSWVAAADMMCAELIDEFEKSNPNKISSKYNPFKRGYKAENILKAVLDENKIYFLIKFEEKEEAEYVTSKVANVECTEKVIEYYQKKIEWR